MGSFRQKETSAAPFLRVVASSAPAGVLAESSDPTHLLLDGESVPPFKKEDVIYALLETVLLRRKFQQQRGGMHI